MHGASKLFPDVENKPNVADDGLIDVSNRTNVAVDAMMSVLLDDDVHDAAKLDDADGKPDINKEADVAYDALAWHPADRSDDSTSMGRIVQ